MKTEVLAPSFPLQAEVDYRIEVKFRFNVTAFVACQNVNVYLLNNVGNMLSAGEPTLLLGERPCWKCLSSAPIRNFDAAKESVSFSLMLIAVQSYWNSPFLPQPGR